MNSEVAIDQLVAEMGELIASITLAETENTIVPRFNQSKTVAYVNAEFRVHDDIPEELKQGIFSRPISYPAKLRFANATKRDDSKKDIRGLSIRLSNVDGTVLWGNPGFQDFVLNSHPALFVATPEDFLAFIRAQQQGKIKMLLFFLNPFNPHLKALFTVLKSQKNHLSPFDVRYWSTVPFRLGELGNQVVKYSVLPCSDYETTDTVNGGEHQLRAAIKAHLQQSPACFHFAVQKQTDPKSMPIEDASVIWDEEVSPFIPVATIKIADQDINNPEILANGERCSFNPWQCLAAHEPLGRMNLVRRLVYAKAAELRNKE
ncbi:hypothetical protein [Methyloglobulus sp.]|uniref:hypothetical protein n=1 Tax=Methyloglobulus sp. TaxID=2518622 RepID=UPI0039891128